MLEVLDATDVRRWGVLVRALLAAHRADIDRLNVYPVPDGDTGTNLYLTFDSAMDAVVHERETRPAPDGLAGPDAPATQGVVAELRDLARSILLSARGNSGVILSQLVGGFADTVAAAATDRIDARLLAEATSAGAVKARAAVGDPVEGTILTVADASAGAALRSARAGGSLADVAEAGLRAAEEALEATTGQLEQLRRAGVVDAGGAGFVLLAEALHRVVHGGTADLLDPTEEAGRDRRQRWGATGETAVDPTVRDVGADLTEDGPAYEVMFLLERSDPDRVAALRARLTTLGDSLVVAGGPDTWNVHVHVDDPGAAVEAGLAAGTPSRIRITHFAAQVAAHAGSRPGPVRREPVARVPSAGIGVVACAAGPGIAEVMAGAGAVVVASGPGARASTGQLLAAVRATGKAEVVVLPNDKDTVLAAQAAAEAAATEGVRVRVVRSRTVVQGLAALAVLDPAGDLDDVVLAMSEASAATRHGGVTVAAQEGLTSAGPCRPGDVLGVVDGDFALIGTDLEAVADEVLDRLLSSGGEIVTVVSGEGAPAGVAERVRARTAELHRGIEVVDIDGGQPHYPLLLGVE